MSASSQDEQKCKNGLPEFVFHDETSLSKRTYIRWHIDVTLPAVIIAPERNQDLGVFIRVVDRCRAAVVHFVCGLVRIPERSCHFCVRTSVGVSAEFLLQGVVDRVRIRFMILHDMKEHDAVVGVGGEFGVFGGFILSLNIAS